MKQKTSKKINQRVYGLLTGMLLIVIGILWILAVGGLISIDGFGFGSIVNTLPIVGYVVIILGIGVCVLNALAKPIEGSDRKKLEAVNEVSQFEKKHIKAVIFDLDGTLLDTAEDLAVACNTVLKAHQYPIQPMETVRNSLGNGMVQFVRNMVPETVSEDELKHLVIEFLEVYDQVYSQKTQPYKHIVSLLETLNRKGYLLAVLSNKRQEYVTQLVAKHFPNIPFVDVLGEQQGIRKPDARLVKVLADKMLLSQREVCFVGDSEVDVLTANNAKMLSVSVEWGFRPTKVLLETNTDYLISHPQELVELLDELNRNDEFVIHSIESVQHELTQ